jgi:hypothetical protein
VRKGGDIVRGRGQTPPLLYKEAHDAFALSFMDSSTVPYSCRYLDQHAITSALHKGLYGIEQAEDRTTSLTHHQEKRS